MKWKTAYTVDEASLLAADIGWFYALCGENQAMLLGKPENSQEWFEREPLDPSFEAEVEELKKKISTKESIYEALVDEIKRADAKTASEGGSVSPLVIYVREQKARDDTRIDPFESKVTRESLAEWFWSFDKQIAAKFDPNINEIMEATSEGNVIESDGNDEKSRGSKTINCYLRLIYALCDALSGGSLTGIKNQDAERILEILAEKGVEAPIGKKTLAEYIDEGREL